MGSPSKRRHCLPTIPLMSSLMSIVKHHERGSSYCHSGCEGVFFHLHVIFQCDDRHSFSLKINNCGFKAIRGVPACLTDAKQHQQQQSARSRPSFRFTLVMNNPVNAARGNSNSLETGRATSTSDLRQPWLTDKTPSIWDF